jgi:hypothetical protein
MKFLASFLLAILLGILPILAADAPGADKFAAGKRKTFSSQGRAKSNGVDLSISYPESWEATDSDNPEVIQIITSSRGFGMEAIRIHASRLGVPDGAPLPAATQAQAFAPEGLKTLVPAGAKLISAKPATLFGRPGGIVEYTRGEKRGPKVLEYHVQTYAFFQGVNRVQVDFQVGGVVGGGPPVAQRMKECKPLFDQIVKTIVLPAGK